MDRLKDQLTFEQEYAFKSVELYKTETLGTGSYGAACKAKCDELICAAKLLYPVLFEMKPQAPEPGKEHRQPALRFELECRFLSRINHPNIVQYLGTYRDPDTNAPVLLMELMDESLTHFLESSPGPIPYHVQVNLCYDIAQALAFLHSNGIIHRDLSSNNVLLLGNRAKVTDFGMSKFTNIAATMTMCPGTPAFMPPEALNEPPAYTEKIDNFSLGVMIVQVVTKQFPKPTDRFVNRELVDPKFPDCKVQAQVPVPEAERRHAHISLIDPTHPLLPIAFHCLKDKDTERPSSQELCRSLAFLKEMAMYEESSQQDKDQIQRAKEEQLETQSQQLEAQRQELETVRGEMQQLQRKLEQETRDRATSPNTSRLRRELDQKERQLLTKSDQLRAHKRQLDTKDDEIHMLRETLEKLNRDLVRSEELRQDASQRYQDAQNECDVRESRLRQLNLELHSNEGAIREYQRENRLTETKTNSLSEQMASKDIQIQELKSQLQLLSREHKRHEEATLRRTPEMSRHSTPGSSPRHTPVTERKSTFTLGKPPAAPFFIKAGSCAVIEYKTYFRSAGSQSVCKYDALSKMWSTTPKHPLYGFTLVCVDGTLVSVGGFAREESSSSLYSLIDKKWTEDLPAMPIKRDRPTAVYANNHLVVAGGCDSQNESLKTVNILDVRTKQWYKASSLPFPVYHASATLCGDDLYLTAGDGQTDSKACTVMTCSLNTLAQSKRPLSVGARFKKAFTASSPTGVWQTATNLPVRQSHLVNVNDQLFAIGGIDARAHHTKCIYRYNHSTEKWDIMREIEMSIARSSCLAAVLMNNNVLIVGGSNVPTKDVETITFN